MAAAIHGNTSQNARQRALADFKSGRARVLVATDIAARGIDVADISHVVNFELPNIPESYVHRIGRTARAGAAGIAISFCDPAERSYLRDIERLTRRPLTEIKPQVRAAVQAPAAAAVVRPKAPIQPVQRAA
jgi:ATP-dependent RNA helicase RhlE